MRIKGRHKKIKYTEIKNIIPKMAIPLNDVKSKSDILQRKRSANLKIKT